MTDELVEMDAITLGSLVRKNKITAAELVESVIERIERLNPTLNAVIHPLYEQAREFVLKNQTGGSGKKDTKIFDGVPFLLKDLIAEYKDSLFCEGSASVQGYVSSIDSELVRRQKAAGLIIVGKTNTPEFGLLPTTEPLFHGPTKNPWDPSLTPGGSSGGSAAAVAAGIVPMAHGNDGGGSIRCPASCCGLFGLKPTRGRNPAGPLFGDLGSGIAHEHAVTRTVRDSAALLDATCGPDFGDPYHAPQKERPYLDEVARDPGRLKIGFLTGIPQGWNDEVKIHPDCENAVQDAARLCESLGHTLEEIPADDLSFSNLYLTFGNVFCCFAGKTIAYWEKALGKKITEDQLEPMTWASYQAGLKWTGADYLDRIEQFQLFSRKIARYCHRNDFDLVLSPTLPIPPPKLGSFEPSADDPMQAVRMTRAFVALTFAYNITGQPAMSVPLFWNTDNIPIGVQFAARFGDEATLFQLAGQLEQARPWTNHRPPIHVSN